MRKTLIIPIFIAVAFLSTPQYASAYVGPGSGITVIGAALAFIAGIFLAIVGFIWYPLKRLWRRANRVQKADNANLDSRSN